MRREMNGFLTESGLAVPAVTADQMREVDRIAVEEFGLGLLQMMENAGRNLAGVALEMLGGSTGPVAVLAGKGGNGGGGLCCARHLHNRGIEVALLLDGSEEELTVGPANQFAILRAAGVVVADPSMAEHLIAGATLVVDALIGYSLRGAPSGRGAELIAACGERARRVLSLDVPSGVDATSGERPGVAIEPDRTLTLALPKTGLADLDTELYLGDIGIPPEAYRGIGLEVPPLFGDRYWIRCCTSSVR